MKQIKQGKEMEDRTRLSKGQREAERERRTKREASRETEQ